MSIAERIKAYIDENGIKQNFVAQKAGMSEDTLSKILCRRKRMLADEFLSICKALEIDPNTFRETA